MRIPSALQLNISFDRRNEIADWRCSTKMALNQIYRRHVFQELASYYYTKISFREHPTMHPLGVCTLVQTCSKIHVGNSVENCDSFLLLKVRLCDETADKVRGRPGI